MGDLVADWWPYVAALLPTIGLAYLFYVVMKHIVEADRRERFAQREWEQRHGAVPKPGARPATPGDDPATDADGGTTGTEPGTAAPDSR